DTGVTSNRWQMTKQWESASRANTVEAPGIPQGVQLSLIHVRSRRIPCDWVRGFGRDLSLANLDRTIEGALARSSPGGGRLRGTRTPSPPSGSAVLRPRERARCRSHLCRPAW